MMARLCWPVRIEVEDTASEEVRSRFGRRHATRAILKETFKLTPEEVISVQDTGSTLAFDVSFFEIRVCLGFMEEWKRRRLEEPVLESLRLRPLFEQGFLPLILRMYNPFVGDQEALAYLAHQVEEVRGGTRLYDEEGFWTLRRRFAVKLKRDLKVPGGGAVGDPSCREL